MIGYASARCLDGGVRGWASPAGCGQRSPVAAAGLVTVPAAAQPTSSRRSLWLSPEQIAALPASGPAWEAMRQAADGGFDTASLTKRNRHNTQVLAAALVAARLDNDGYRARVRDQLALLVAAPVDDGDVLAACRRLGTYAIAADVIDLAAFDAAFDRRFRGWLAAALAHSYDGGGGGGTIAEVHERRPNNFGTHAAASRIATAAYLGDTDELARAAEVFAGWLGEPGGYRGFTFSDPAWQTGGQGPLGVNPVGAKIAGHNVDGVLPDDQRRSGGFRWPPPRENYVWEALQGATVAAALLDRQGYPAWAWGDRALLRAAVWLHEEADFPAEGDDRWQPWLLNRAYGTSFPAGGGQGKNMAWTEWTHGSQIPAGQRRPR